MAKSMWTPLLPTLGIAHSDLRLACNCSVTEIHFMKLQTHSSCADAAFSGFVISLSGLFSMLHVIHVCTHQDKFLVCVTYLK